MKVLDKVLLFAFQIWMKFAQSNIDELRDDRGFRK